MADMGKRHQRLIADAVEKGVIAAFDNPTLQRKLEKPVDRETVLVCVVHGLAESLGDALRFTNDNFDHKQAEDFRSTLIRHVQEGLRAKRADKQPA